MEARWDALAALVALAAGACSVAAQAPERTPVTIDYVGVEGVYLAVGAEQGLSVGDTLEVFEGPDSTEPLGLLALISVARRRSVGVSVAGALDVTQGSVIYLGLTTAPAPAPDAAAAPAAPVSAGGPRAPARQLARSPTLSGTLALDVDLRETHASWTGELFGNTRRRFATPTSRLALTARELPGGLEMRTSLRASYRYADQPFPAPTTSFRAYELSVAKRFEAVPLEVRLGRLRNPYDGFGGYWDGGVVRLGGRSGPGIGFAVGYEPNRTDEGFSSDVPKLAGFADFAAGGRRWRYDTDVSLHLEWPTGLAERRRWGWSQRLGLGPLSLSHRLRYQTTADAPAWELGELRVRTGLRLARGLTLRGTYDRARPGSSSAILPLGLPLREEISGGVVVASRTASISAELGRMRSAETWGRSIGGSGSLRMGALSLFVSGRRWSRASARSLSLGPGLGLQLGRTFTRLTYRMYETETGTSALTSHSVEGRTSFDLSEALSLSLGAGQQWGASLTGSRVRLGIWRRF